MLHGLIKEAAQPLGFGFRIDLFLAGPEVFWALEFADVAGKPVLCRPRPAVGVEHGLGLGDPLAQQLVLDRASLRLGQAFVKDPQLDEGAGLGLGHLAVLDVSPLAACHPQGPGNHRWAGLGPVLGRGDGPAIALTPVAQEAAELDPGRIELVLEALHWVAHREPIRYHRLLREKVGRLWF